MKKLLAVVDYQNDFVNGALGFEGAEGLEPGIFNAVQQTLEEGGCVIFTRDTHDENYLQSREGAYLPVPHCIKGTKGHQLFGRLHQYEEKTAPRTMVMDKATFGSLELGENAAALCGSTPDVIELCGLVTDICVISNAIILHTRFPNAEIRVLAGLCGSGNAAAAEQSLAILRGLGIKIIP